MKKRAPDVQFEKQLDYIHDAMAKMDSSLIFFNPIFSKLCRTWSINIRNLIDSLVSIY